MVAKSQIGEVLEVLKAEVAPSTLLRVLEKLKGTRAYTANKSFRDTIDALISRSVAGEK